MAVHDFHHLRHALGLTGGEVFGFAGIAAEMILHRLGAMIHIILHEFPISLQQGAAGLLLVDFPIEEIVGFLFPTAGERGEV